MFNSEHRIGYRFLPLLGVVILMAISVLAGCSDKEVSVVAPSTSEFSLQGGMDPALAHQVLGILGSSRIDGAEDIQVGMMEDGRVGVVVVENEARFFTMFAVRVFSGEVSREMTGEIDGNRLLLVDGDGVIIQETIFEESAEGEKRWAFFCEDMWNEYWYCLDHPDSYNSPCSGFIMGC
jgi:hypothetical protein